MCPAGLDQLRGRIPIGHHCSGVAGSRLANSSDARLRSKTCLFSSEHPGSEHVHRRIETAENQPAAVEFAMNFFEGTGVSSFN